MGLPDVARTVAEHMTRNKRDFALIGAFALYAYGYVRATRDIDFVVRLSDRAAVCRLLESLGFTTTHVSDAFSNHVHPVGPTQVDFMYVEGATADSIFAEATTRAVFDGQQLPVVSPTHLLTMKLFSAGNNAQRRLKDLADAAEIVRRTGIEKRTVQKLCTRYGLEKYLDEIAGT